MNELSWFLYVADVIGNIKALLVIFAVVGTMLAFMASFGWVMSQNELEKDDPSVKFMGKAMSFLIPAVVAASLLAAISPSKKTIYLIAGSEAGEAVVTSKEGQEIIDDIRLVIKSQLENMKGN